MNSATRPPWHGLASAALRAGVRDEWVTAAKTVTRINAEHGGDVIPGVLAAWIDTMVLTCGAPPADALVLLAWLNADTGTMQPADEVPPPARWAGRLILARAQLDREQFEALINSVQSREEWTHGVLAVLRSCALSLRAHASGRAS